MENFELIKEKPLYAVEFNDGSVFNGGSFNAPGWAKCPNENIKSLKLFLPGGSDMIQLSEYDGYNFLIGARKPLDSNRITLAHMYGFGRKEDTVTSYRITLLSSDGDKYRAGDITVRMFPFGKEGTGRTSITGWKNGICKISQVIK